jgi:hypothetical protein
MALVLTGSYLNAGEPQPTAPAPDKSQYHLFHPVPKQLLREMSTDRPDTTESPITVDAGHFQLEASFFDYTRDKADGGTRSEVWGYGLVNFKAGLTNNIDLQIVFDSYTEERTQGAGVSETTQGFSDITARVKINLWGNDGGSSALAIMPYVKAPTGTVLSNDEWEGGIIVPFGFDLADGIGVGLMAEADWVYNEDDGNYDIEWLHSATIGFDLTEKMGLYVEAVGIASAAEGFQYQAFFDTGLTYRMNENVQFDCGTRIGLTDASDDIGVFAGVSVRY